MVGVVTEQAQRPGGGRLPGKRRLGGRSARNRGGRSRDDTQRKVAESLQPRLPTRPRIREVTFNAYPREEPPPNRYPRMPRLTAEELSVISSTVDHPTSHPTSSPKTISLYSNAPPDVCTYLPSCAKERPEERAATPAMPYAMTVVLMSANGRRDRRWGGRPSAVKAYRSQAPRCPSR